MEIYLSIRKQIWKSVRQGGGKMRHKIFILIGFAVLLFCPKMVLSDCADLGRSTGWYVVDDQSIIFYVGNSPHAKIVLQDCTMNCSSNIRLLKTYVCENDRLLVGGQ